MKQRYGELRSTIARLVRDITGKLVLAYNRAEDDNVRSRVCIAFAKCFQLLRNRGDPRTTLILLKQLLEDVRWLGVEVDEALVRKAVELAQEFTS
ncbi:MAG: hypothetical protein QW503_02355 [Sulfolobales archaeon]